MTLAIGGGEGINYIIDSQTLIQLVEGIFYGIKNIIISRNY